MSTSRAKSAVVRYEGRQTGPRVSSELSIDRRPHTAAASTLLRASVAQHNKLHRNTNHTTRRYQGQSGIYKTQRDSHNSDTDNSSSAAGAPPRSRLLVPDDCCRYCELYQEDRIAAARHQTTQIVAWAQDVSRSMQDERNQSKPVRKRQRISFLKYEPPGRPTGMEGYRRVKAVPGRKKCDLLNNTKMFGEDTIADVTSNLAHLAVKFDAEYNGPPHGPTKILMPVAKKRSSRPSAKRVNGEAPESARSSAPSKHLSCDTTRMSSRSCSNELLNVITIDDAYKRHRQRLINHRPQWGNEKNEEDDDDEDTDTDDDDEDCREFCESRAITDGRTTESRAITYGNMDENTDSKPSHLQFEPPESHPTTTNDTTTPQTPRQSATKRETIRIQSGLTMRQLSPTSPNMFVVEEEKYETIEDTPIDGPNENVLRAIDGMISTRNVTHNNAHTGFYRHGKSSNSSLPPSQPESRRFKQLNRKLHKLIDMDYVPNRMSARIQDESKKRSQPNNAGHNNSNNTTLNNEQNGLNSARSGQSNDRFLEILMDMEKKGEQS